jgi:hypothetical protein
MMRRERIRAMGALIAASLATACLWTTGAQAAFVSTGSGTTIAASDSYLASAGSTASAPVYSTQSGSDYLLAVPGQYNFNHFFSGPQTAVLGTDATAGDYSFQDSYVFQVGASASGDTAVATLNLPPSFGMADLQMRLYEITPGTATPVVGQSLLGQSSVISVISPWVGTPGSDTRQIVASFSGLTTAGTYVLDIAGVATGSSGGQYFGALDLQPVPLPVAAWLLVSGLAFMGVCGQRHKWIYAKAL